MDERDCWQFERKAQEKGYAVICGLDEAGRGPLAGDVYAGAVILPPDFDCTGLDDSKKLTPKRREALFDRICREADWAVGTATAAEIDEINILNASLLAMRRAVEKLRQRPDYLLVDGNQFRGFAQPGEAIVKGDSRSASVAAASIIAKVSRDHYMETLAEKYPAYQFAQHKGYPTALHYALLAQYGPCPEHRRSFLKKLHTPGERPADASGQMGEEAAVRYLQQQGYTVLVRNWRAFADGKMVGEADIIAREGAQLVLVEVKQRRDGVFAPALEAITPAKRKKLVLTAEAYLAEQKLRETVRIDAVEVYTGQPRDSAFGVTYPPPVIRLTRNLLAE